MKVVINRCFGKFGLSKEAYEYMNIPYEEDGIFCCPKKGFFDPDRNDPKLVKCVETLKEKAAGPRSRLKVIEIPDNISWYISNYSGKEFVEEEHRSWC